MRPVNVHFLRTKWPIENGAGVWARVQVVASGRNNSIVANRPGMAGTVPEFWALSRWYTGCPGIYTHLALRLSLAWMAAAVSIVSSLVLFDTHKATKAVRRHFLAEKNFRPTILAPACDPTTLFARTWKFSTMRVSW